MSRNWCIAPLAGLLALAVAVPAEASVSRTEAARAAIGALGVRDRTGPEIVFGARTPVQPGASIRVAGTPRPLRQSDDDTVTGAGATRSEAPLLARITAASWVFYNDRAPRGGAGRPGRVAIVRVRDGAVTLTDPIVWPPAIGGELPAYLRTEAAYESDLFRVFERGVARASSLRATPTAGQLFDDVRGDGLSQAMAGARRCILKAGDLVPGQTVFGADGLRPTGEAVTRLFTRLDEIEPAIGVSFFNPNDSLSVAKWLTGATAGCNDTLLWIAGGAYPDNDAISLGQRIDGSRVTHLDLSLPVLRDALKARSTTRFTIVVDTRNARRFLSLTSLPNVFVAGAPPRVGAAGSRRVSSPYLLNTTAALFAGLSSTLRSRDWLLGASNAKACQLGFRLLVVKALNPNACPAPAAGASAPTPPAPAPTIPVPEGPVLLADRTDLSVGLSVSPARPKKNETVRITVSVTNSGQAQADGARVATDLPESLTPTTFSGVASIVGRRVTWETGSIPPGAVRVQVIEAKATDGATGDVVSEVLAASPQDLDSTPGNGASGEDDLDRRTVAPVTADLLLGGFLVPGPYRVEQDAGLGFTLVNDGDETATNIQVAIRLDDKIGALAAQAGQNSGSVAFTSPFPALQAVWSIPSLAPGATATFGGTLTMGSATGTSTVTAEVTALDQFDRDSKPGNAAQFDEDDDYTATLQVTR